MPTRRASVSAGAPSAARDVPPLPSAVRGALPSAKGGLASQYKVIFDRIDKDRSGAIDAAELAGALASQFPEACFTGADIKAMMEEADLNHDGVVSFAEFCAVMERAEGAASHWSRARASLWGHVARSLQETAAVVRSAAEPLRAIARAHSYEASDGKRIVTPGLRFAVGVAATLIRLTFLDLLVMELMLFPALAMISDARAIASSGLFDLAFGSAASILVMAFVAYELWCFASGQSIAFYFLGLEVVDTSSRRVFGFAKMLGLQLFWAGTLQAVLIGWNKLEDMQRGPTTSAFANAEPLSYNLEVWTALNKSPAAQLTLIALAGRLVDGGALVLSGKSIMQRLLNGVVIVKEERKMNYSAVVF